MSEYKSILISLAIAAGKKIMRYYLTSYKTEYKSDNSPVTDADKDADKCILEGLKKTNIPIISEETPAAELKIRKNWKRFWLVDPLDGTCEFVNGNDEFTVNIALVEGTTVVEGVIYVPTTRTIYYGNVTEGAMKISDVEKSMQEESLPCMKNSEVYTVVSSKSHLSASTQKFIDRICENNDKSKVLQVGSSLKFCNIAEGRYNLYPRADVYQSEEKMVKSHIHEWDVAAGHAILKSAGGNVVCLETAEELQYNSDDLLVWDFFAYGDECEIDKLKKKYL